ncbi:alpha/beta fold hydrolase [Deinococcus humi]|uniref:Pimeloyl-ACP methyl ester carboxylesterase n=1 Tax=Deinococcus humi TaxID=662880 RepID=A0A7W8JRR5_9DEIO|nr:alpha/beta hydrolase [Deinococcus humi]MBB5362007.1 pimeloyl-ACP methyl ester carboxylesterase [Deinococcus humi]GGO22561.1 alpha/beta hydrolase [Deinococcus humi]
MKINRKTVALILLAGAVAVGLAACAPTATTAAVPDARATADLRPAVSGERKYLELPGFGQVAYYADTRGEGRPLVLTPSVNAAASAYEMKPVWDAYVGTRPVYALEWPGFGSSARPDTTYTKELMTRSLNALVAQIGTEVDVVGLSLGSEFAARAALSEPRIRSLALISPSGLGQPRGGTQEANAEDGGRKLYDRLNAVSTPLYAALRTKPSIEFFLSRSFRGPVESGLVAYSLDTSRQPGAKYAPVYFISGQLFTDDAYGELYSKLTIPVIVLYDQDGFVSFDRLQQFTQQDGVRAVRIEGTDGLPQFEKMPEVKAALDAFWAGQR